MMLRGINHMNIFLTDGDKDWFIDRLRRIIYPQPDEKGRVRLPGCKLLAYCLMDNHVHLLLREDTGTVSDFVKRVASAYALHFNARYHREGGLFQGRYRSENVEDFDYLLSVVRYIHRNPLSAGLASRADDYRWTSWSEYARRGSHAFPLCEINPQIIGNVEKFTALVTGDCDADSLPVCCRFARRLTDEQAMRVLNRLMGTEGHSGDSVNRLARAERDKVIASALDGGVGQRQLARLTALSLGVIAYVAKRQRLQNQPTQAHDAATVQAAGAGAGESRPVFSPSASKLSPDNRPRSNPSQNA